MIGCFLLTPHHLAANRVCDIETAQWTLEQLEKIGFIKWDRDADVVLLPKFLSYNPICNKDAGSCVLKLIQSL